MPLENYKQLLRSLSIPTVSLGYSTVYVYDTDDLAEAQLGYSVDPSGASLIDDAPGSWQAKWVVIGYEESSADPIFIDAEAEGFPVYTAMHGSGKWEPELIATGLENFATAMRDCAKIAEGRENPIKLEANPIQSDERNRLLERIQKDNEGIDSGFWQSLLQ